MGNEFSQCCDPAPSYDPDMGYKAFVATNKMNHREQPKNMPPGPSSGARNPGVQPGYNPPGMQPGYNMVSRPVGNFTSIGAEPPNAGARPYSMQPEPMSVPERRNPAPLPPPVVAAPTSRAGPSRADLLSKFDSRFDQAITGSNPQAEQASQEQPAFRVPTLATRHSMAGRCHPIIMQKANASESLLTTN
ncbi:hypothetical protein T484DRAFT_1848682 [Baffinella frigidus]|nr:hypothetical protein T484DRAFT_1848682 [Cryptophyta sp. CCMP2293]